MRPLNFAWGGVSLITTRLSVMVLQVMLKGDDTVTIIYSVCLSAPLLVLCFSFVAGRQVLIREVLRTLHSVCGPVLSDHVAASN